MISIKTQALRFRIWQYASPREWDVTIAEIAEGIGESLERVRACVAHNQAWHGRVRWTSEPSAELTSWQGGVRMDGRMIAQDILAGRVNMEV